MGQPWSYPVALRERLADGRELRRDLPAAGGRGPVPPSQSPLCQHGLDVRHGVGRRQREEAARGGRRRRPALEALHRPGPVKLADAAVGGRPRPGTGAAVGDTADGRGRLIADHG